ncbi:hypothetical protein BGW37DRAFT_431400 [Umbelopsis sp. PMI_123]|nr:hypothetical protein BGW37DRAFT_431400 [Umbelopsis sp. PMI_123]
MQKKLIKLAQLLLLTGHVLAKPVGNPEKFEWNKNKVVFAFGDSYTYTQGEYGLTNFSWNTFQQLDKHGRVIVEEDPILLNQVIDISRKTSAGGPNWIEYVTGCYSGLPSKCKHSLYNIAFAGADVDPTKIELHHNFSIDYVTQIDQWFTYVQPKVEYKSSNTLAASFIGINDVGDTSKWTNVSFPVFFDGLISSVFDGLERLYAADIKSFLIINVPPIDRAPGSGGKPMLTANINIYNSILSNYTTAFASNHIDAHVFYVDTYAYLNTVLDNAPNYGFKNITSFCPNYDAPDFNTNYAAYGCLAPYEYFWYNSGHITYPVHKLLAGKISDMLNAGTTV